MGSVDRWSNATRDAAERGHCGPDSHDSGDAARDDVLLPSWGGHLHGGAAVQGAELHLVHSISQVPNAWGASVGPTSLVSPAVSTSPSSHGTAPI